MDYTLLNKPLLVIPFMIVQPTWGGQYIAHLKGWHDRNDLSSIRIGQSYELSSIVNLSLDITDSSDSTFLPEIGDADGVRDSAWQAAYSPESIVRMSEAVKQFSQEMLGVIAETHGSIMPLLIKLNQAKGNSFQLHVKEKTGIWEPKPESWYYLEDGYVSFGIKKGVRVEEYKQCCLDIDTFMKNISTQIQNGTKTIDTAEEESHTYIREKNPWQYVNLHQVKKYDMLDLSGGELHHSWETDNASPYGNVVFEVQRDVLDNVSTLRSFDQGKIKEDGSVRTIQIEEYFAHLNTDEEYNDITNHIKTPNGTRLVTTPYYALDCVTVEAPITQSTGDSFVHLYVRDGDVTVTGNNHTIRVSQGHSCFIPHSVGSYTISPKTPSVILSSTITH